MHFENKMRMRVKKKESYYELSGSNTWYTSFGVEKPTISGFDRKCVGGAEILYRLRFTL